MEKKKKQYVVLVKSYIGSKVYHEGDLVELDADIKAGSNLCSTEKELPKVSLIEDVPPVVVPPEVVSEVAPVSEEVQVAEEAIEASEPEEIKEAKHVGHKGKHKK